MLPPGTRIGSRYLIDRLLGQGGMSNLYIATDLSQGRAVRVIKEMTARYPDPQEQKMAEGLFMREAQLLATLNHPNIPKVFDKFLFQGKYYLSMEYVQGEDLGKLITDKGVIEEAKVASYGAQMATVLYYLHRQNPTIVFRDVKPSNIMIVNDQVKLIDFGIARMLTPAKKGDTMRIGSPGYAPPEQYGGQTDPRSDIYALGVTMHHAVTGYDPTVSQTPFIIPPPRSINPKVSPQMEAIIQKATQLDPDKRYDNCLEMKRDLQEVLRLHGITTGQSMPLQPPLPAAAPSAGPSAVAPPLPLPTAAAPVPVAPTANPSTSPSTSTAAPNTQNAAPQAAAKAAQSSRKRRGFPFFPLLLMLMVGGAFAAPPALRQRAWTQLVAMWQQIKARTEPVSTLSPAEQVLLGGGSLPLATESLAETVRSGKASAAQKLAYGNALAYSSGRPLKRLAVLSAPEAKVGDTLAAWQQASWRDTNPEGALLVVAWTEVDGSWKGALQDAQDGKGFRSGSDAVHPDGVLVFPPPTRPDGWKDQFADAHGVYWGVTPTADDPAGVQTLQPGAFGWPALLHSFHLDDALWLAPTPPSGVKSQAWSSPAALTAALKKNPPPLVVSSAQLAQSGWPAAVRGARLVTVWPGGTLPTRPPAAPAGARLLALTQGSPFHPDANVAEFFGRELQPDVYDHAAWVTSELFKLPRTTGLSWHHDHAGSTVPARWTLLEAMPGGQSWKWLADGAERP